MLNQTAINTYKDLVKSKGLLPILVSPFFQKKVDEEIQFLWHENWPHDLKSIERTLYL